jgi:hypothetical protein
MRSVMLNAIAIYHYETNPEQPPKRLTVAQQDKSLFASNQLASLETNSMPKVLSLLGQAAVILLQVNNEFHYFSECQSDQYILAICSKKRLESSEIYYLFENMRHVLYRSQSVKFSLADIVGNPLGYTGKSGLITTIQSQTDDAKKNMLVVLERTLNRGENIEELLPKAIQLKDDADIHLRMAKKRNRCCKMG